MWITSFFVKRKQQQELRQWAIAVHDALVQRALAITRDQGLDLPDDFSLRFEVMILLTARYLHRLKEQENQGSERLQALWDMTFEGLEYSLRERGVNDIRIAARMRKLFMEATGRRDAYIAALVASDPTLLARAIGRNVLNGAPPEDPRVVRLLAWVMGDGE